MLRIQAPAPASARPMPQLLHQRVQCPVDFTGKGAFTFTVSKYLRPILDGGIFILSPAVQMSRDILRLIQSNSREVSRGGDIFTYHFYPLKTRTEVSSRCIEYFI